MTFKPTLCLDFDGVLHSYTSKWQGATVIPDPPVPGAREFLLSALEKFDVCVLSSRSHEEGGRSAMSRWMSGHFGGSTVEIAELGEDTKVWWTPESNCLDVPGVSYVTFPLHKPPAHLTIDDRALTFTGVWPSVDELSAFRPWNKEGALADVEVPAEGTEERDFWFETAVHYGLEPVGVHGAFQASDDAVFRLMAACREQGRRDILGLPPKEPK